MNLDLRTLETSQSYCFVSRLSYFIEDKLETSQLSWVAITIIFHLITFGANSQRFAIRIGQ